jgi:type II secretory ATPase GspE/PulE/Tfp pilus assembly ATPase PilB-like protein
MNDKLPSIEDLLAQRRAAQAPVAPPSSAPVASTVPASAQAQAFKPEAPIEVDETSKSAQLSTRMNEIEKQGKEREAEMNAATIGLPYISLKGFPISPDALRLIPEEQARDLRVLCFFFNGPQLRIGAVNPNTPEIKELVFQLGERHKTNASLYQISDESFVAGIELFKALPKIIPIVKGVQIHAEELEKYQSQMQTTADIQKVIAKANVTDILSIVIAAAVKLNSSDIHIEAEEKGIMVRFRVDGVLQDVATVDVHEWKKIINRIKLIASLKLNITDIPQDGRFTIFQKDKKIDVRTSTIPTAWGESVVMRVLNPDSIQLNFEDLGFRPAALKRLLPEIEKPNGMILTTGPTGSGKTTTLYAILGKLNEPGVKIITLEDPVEYRLEGINQSQIDHSKDYTFSKGLRSILRQDPDIVMVGEIRDLETADAAIQAALTGHLLLSTIHTNDAAGAVPRFLSMGVKPFLLAPALTVAMGQRLLRKLCKECKQPDTVDADTLAKVNEHLNAITPASGETIPTERNFWKAVGCDKCNNTGYKGRVGAYEILIKNKKIEEFILSGEVSEYKMREVAAEQGMIDMAQDGLLKALEGMTTIDEVKRIVGL